LNRHHFPRSLMLAATMTTFMTNSGTALALFAQGPNACENAVAERFDGVSMAEITASTAYDKRHGEAKVDWTVSTDYLSASGVCKINKGGTVLRLTVEHEKHRDQDNSTADTDGFYFDRDSGHWRTSDTDEVCYSCTPENGFPRRGRRGR